LFATNDGMQALQVIIAQGYAFLSECLIVEHGDQQGERVIQLFKDYQYHTTLKLRDLQGKHRATAAFKKPWLSSAKDNFGVST
jgi:methylase of polypeptide subunit release factors